MDSDLTLKEIVSDSLPQVDVRVVLFTICNGKLWVALDQQYSGVALPRGRPLPEESLDLAATRILANTMGVRERYLEQLYSIAQGSLGSWTVTVAYLGLAIADISNVLAGDTWFDAADVPDMNSLDRLIVDYALLRLRAKLSYTTIAFHLLPRTFSLSDLQQVYEAVLGRQLDKRNFRRRIQTAGILEATSETRREGSHRPARLFRFRAVHDADTYLTPAWANTLNGETASS
jgi:8-oxo-dGTP diphosphatase